MSDVDRRGFIGVVGLGYVGLPLCLAFAEAEVRVLGFDIDPQKAQALRSGSSYLKHINATRIARAVDEQFLDATADASRLGEPDAILICVPTPLTAHQEPDLRFIQATVAAIAEHFGDRRVGLFVEPEQQQSPVDRIECVDHGAGLLEE